MTVNLINPHRFGGWSPSVSQLACTGNSAPGAGTAATASLTPVDGHGYLIGVHQFRPLSANPDSVTVSGWGSQTFTEIAGASSLYSVAATNRRRWQTFKCFPSGSSAGALTFTYTNTPDTIDWVVLDLGVTASGVVVASSERISAVDAAYTQNALTELSAGALANARNRRVQFFATNTNNATQRLETIADTGGDNDWTSFTAFGSTTTRTRKMVAGWLNGDDTTPGAICGAAAPVVFHLSIEVDYNF